MKSAGAFKRTMTSTGTIDMHIQRIDDTDVLEIYGVSTASHKAWVDISTDIKEGDIAIDTNDNMYDVVGVSVRGEDIAMNEHKEVILNIHTPTEGTPI